MSARKIILFHINEQVYGIDIDEVRAIEPVAGAVKVPNAPDNIEGIINLRGDVIPVYSLHNKFHLQTTDNSGESKLIITGKDEHVFAIKVDAVEEIVEVEDAKLMTPPMVLHSKDTSYIECIANVKGSLVLCLDVDKILSEAEKDSMMDFVEGLQEE